jgi:hypothetical protein
LHLRLDRAHRKSRRSPHRRCCDDETVATGDQEALEAARRRGLWLLGYDRSHDLVAFARDGDELLATFEAVVAASPPACARCARTR